MLLIRPVVVAHTPRVPRVPLVPRFGALNDSNPKWTRHFARTQKPSALANSLVLLQAPCTVVDSRGRSEWITHSRGGARRRRRLSCNGNLNTRNIKKIISKQVAQRKIEKKNYISAWSAFRVNLLLGQQAISLISFSGLNTHLWVLPCLQDGATKAGQYATSHVHHHTRVQVLQELLAEVRELAQAQGRGVMAENARTQDCRWAC